MAPGKLFEGNVRPQGTGYEDELEDDEAELYSEENTYQSKEGDGRRHLDNNENEGEDSDEGMTDDEGDGAQIADQLRNVSFGALKQAQDSMSRKRKRGSDNTPDQEDKLEALRERLNKIRKDKQRQESKRSRKAALNTKRTSRQASDTDADSNSSDSAPSEEGAAAAAAAAHARTSKHAPMAQTSKRQVTRRRQVVDVPKRHTRDPRFDALGPDDSRNNTHNSEKAYAFLREYQKSEIAELQAALKTARTDDDRTVLRRKLVSMQNTLKTKAANEREREIVRKHRRSEREAVQQGKTPYFLKQKEIRERALVEKFKGMKAKEREKVIEKKRLKESQREKRRMPEGRRSRPG